MDTFIPINAASATITRRVTAADTALAMGSGDLKVLSTPTLVAIMEQAARDAVQPFLPDGFSTVGTRIEIDHLAATLCNETVQAHAELIEQDGRYLIFDVTAQDSSGIIGRGQHRRCIIERERFLGKLKRKKG